MEPIVTGEVYTINVGWTKCLTSSLFHPKPDETVLNSRDKVVIYCQVFCRKRGIAFPDMTPNFELDPVFFLIFEKVLNSFGFCQKFFVFYFRKLKLQLISSL